MDACLDVDLLERLGGARRLLALLLQSPLQLAHLGVALGLGLCELLLSLGEPALRRRHALLQLGRRAAHTEAVALSRLRGALLLEGHHRRHRTRDATRLALGRRAPRLPPHRGALARVVVHGQHLRHHPPLPLPRLERSGVRG